MLLCPLHSMLSLCVASQGMEDVSSYGVGSKIRLPGETIEKPNVYEFGTPYDIMSKDLERKNATLYI